MRTIKFRGKSLDSGEWYYGNLYDKDTAGRTHIGTTKKGCLNIDPDTVGQFTGLKDKNGVEIYEGDVVEVYDFASSYASKYKGKVCVRRGAWCVEHILFDSDIYTPLVFDDFAGRKTEVIGNIYDDQDLLKE